MPSAERQYDLCNKMEKADREQTKRCSPRFLPLMAEEKKTASRDRRKAVHPIVPGTSRHQCIRHQTPGRRPLQQQDNSVL
jgi:hypothetical protein